MVVLLHLRRIGRVMRQVLLALLVLLVACGNGDAVERPPELSVEPSWSGDEIDLTIETNLPDGAILSWDAIEGDDEWDIDAADAGGFATVEDGSATATIDASDFTADEALVGVSLVPGYKEQPDVVTDNYEPNEKIRDEARVMRD